jgi:ribosomal RNA-processing protein 8
MGTNWLDIVEEAYRVLRWKGELWVAEIKSRFAPQATRKGGPQGGKKQPVEHSVGNRRKKAKGKEGGAEEGVDTEVEAADLAVEVDGAEDRRRETDVSAFVAALAKRGFVLHGEGGEAVDMSNKMFVRMRFLKAAPPVKGKGVATVRAAGHEISKKRKFLETGDGEDDGAAEASILKPCVYKLR